MAGRLDGKSIVITGGASGQGRVAAGIFAREGARLVLADASADGLAETLAQLPAGTDVAVSVGDLTTEPANEAMVALAVARSGRLDGLYNASGLVRFSPLHELALAEWEFVISHELTMTYLACKHAVRAMLAGGQGGSIVNMSSNSGFHAGTPRHAAHAATKAGVAGLTKQMAVEYGPQGIRTNAIAPGFIVYAEGQLRIPRQTAPHPPHGIPLGRHVAPEDTAHAALYLLSDESSMMTGQVLTVDGGKSVG
jgi:NAD(P)-dependent dehydrogenase (short-subunit alcohol dehydrogenase family)